MSVNWFACSIWEIFFFEMKNWSHIWNLFLPSPRKVSYFLWEKKTYVSFALIGNIWISGQTGNWHPANFSPLNTCILFVAGRKVMKLLYKLSWFFLKARKWKREKVEREGWKEIHRNLSSKNCCFPFNDPNTLPAKMIEIIWNIWKVSKTAVNTTAPSSLSSS